MAGYIRPSHYLFYYWLEKIVFYQLDIKKVGDIYWLYYNARDGWFTGWEGIGLAVLSK